MTGTKRTEHQATALRFIELDTGCYVPVSHKTNQDGYFRKAWGKGGRYAEMFHRTVWRMHNGPIPEGYEINHICGVRCCQNIYHMECIPGSDHAIKTNEERYSDRKSEAETYWRDHGGTGTALGEKFGVTFSAACRWIREWRAG